MNSDQSTVGTTQELKLTAEEDRTHALLCAVAHQKSRAKEGKGPRAGDYLEHLEQLEEEISDIYFHDRREAENDGK